MAEIELYLGDCVDVMRKHIADESIQCCVTSPPYYGLRDYGVAGQIGLEDTPEQYVERLVEVFREVRRVLKDDGTLWANLGDSYGTGASGQNFLASTGSTAAATIDNAGDFGHKKQASIKGFYKQLLGIPWRVAFALQADGWCLRQDIIWSKPNCMPESVTDRCTKAHEYIFLLSKSAKYYYDAEAIKEPAQEWSGQAATFARTGPVSEHILPGQSAAVHRPDRNDKQSGHGRRYAGFNERWGAAPQSSLRNKRSVWTVATEPYPEAHFATYPTKLIEPCILAGSRPGDTVLDPFNGSGTTGFVSLKHGRHYVGIDLNEEYLNLSNKRLFQVSSQRTIFDEIAAITEEGVFLQHEQMELLTA